MTIYAKVTSKCQTTVPARLREVLGIRPGDSLRYDELPDGRIVVAKADMSLESLRGIVRTDVRLTDEELAQAIHDARAAMAGDDAWP